MRRSAPVRVREEGIAFMLSFCIQLRRTAWNAIFTSLTCLAILGAWGPCAGSEGLQGLGGSSVAVQGALATLRFADLDAYTVWSSKATDTEVIASAEILATLLMGQ